MGRSLPLSPELHSRIQENCWCRFSEPNPPFQNTRNNRHHMGWCRALFCALLHTLCPPSKWIWECDETCPPLSRLYYTCARRGRIYKHLLASSTTALSFTNFLSSTEKRTDRHHGLNPPAPFLKIMDWSNMPSSCARSSKSAYPKTTSHSPKAQFDHTMWRTPPFCLLQKCTLDTGCCLPAPKLDENYYTVFLSIKMTIQALNDLSISSCALSPSIPKIRRLSIMPFSCAKAPKSKIGQKSTMEDLLLLLKRTSKSTNDRSFCAFSQNKTRKTKCPPPVLFLLKLLQSFRMSPPNFRAS